VIRLLSEQSRYALNFPGSANKVGSNVLFVQPRRHSLRNALWPIVTLHIDWSTMWGKEALQHLDDILRRHRAGPVDRQALTGVFVQHCQALQPPPICGLIMDEIITPPMVGVRGTCRCGCALADWGPLAHALHHLEPLLLPYAPDGLATDPPGFTLQQGVQLPIAQPWLSLRQGMHTSH
jgi:hypothetical protein